MQLSTLPELLAPAGSLEKLRYAYAFGADAAYAGIPFFSLRARENEFSLEELRQGLDLARSMGRRLYLTANIFARNRKIQPFYSHLDQWAELKPDALIMSDPGLMLIVRERHPEIPIHLSVQANCMNWQGVRFWAQQGVQRIILSRELTLEEIRTIKDKVPEVELESFVHGAICIAYSGRCLLSSYMSYRDANQGVCDNSCREKFHVYKTPSTDENFFVEDLRNKGEFYRVDEDENGTFIMNAKDLRLIEHLKEIMQAGVSSLKIEGRTKSIYYVSIVTRAYRQALNDLAAGRDVDSRWITELDKVANRGYHKGFLMGEPQADDHNYKVGTTRHSKQRFGGLVRPEERVYDGWLPIEVKGPVSVGDRCELIHADGTSDWLTIEAIRTSRGKELAKANPGIGTFHVPASIAPRDHSILSVQLESN
ncbi:MAG: U32 family peptidase [Bdellovibrionales bacterium]|nr:U32 family peptidase [Bdellovibrionales bacterium]